jgi:3' exoribonuclease, RNase T-like
VIAFLDTEFTDLVIRPRLLSVGLAADGTAGSGSKSEFYAEVTDPDRIRATGWFGLSAVLPQFGKVTHAACTYAELGARLSTFLGDMVAALKSGASVEVAYGYPLDWELVEHAIQDSGARDWESTRRRLRPVNVYDITGFGSGKLAAEVYFESQAAAPFSRHHALCDARALREAYEAATQGLGALSEATLALEVQTHRKTAA